MHSPRSSTPPRATQLTAKATNGWLSVRDPECPANPEAKPSLIMRISREFVANPEPLLRHRPLRATAIHRVAAATDTIPVSTPYRLGCYRRLLMPEMDRRRMILTTGIGVLAAALPIPDARADPSR